MKLPLHLRKSKLERLLARRPEGIFVNPFERGEIGPDLFRAACDMGLEGLVSKRRERRSYVAGPCKYWIEAKRRQHPTMGGSCKFQIPESVRQNLVAGEPTNLFEAVRGQAPSCFISALQLNLCGIAHRTMISL
ncbi:hypothetical protein [Bradyrhizobium sp. Gha]|uniref:hypothetical protein n=1 Tax=Bradyrhizobium sp. Gha TaxID=1855318 RepID=UPI000A72E8B9